MISQVALFLLVSVSTSLGALPPGKCYRYEDITAKYKMRHDKAQYPTGEINLVLERYPNMKNMFYEDEHTHATLPAPHVSPLSSVCPHSKFTLYSFFYANKDCHVIYPDVQQIYYVQCSPAHNRNCQQCGYYHSNVVSKCVEDFQYRYVWAYCTTTVVTPDPHPRPRPQPHPRPHPEPEPEPEPKHLLPVPAWNHKTGLFTPIEQFKPPTLIAQPLLPEPNVSRKSQTTSYMGHYHGPWNRIYHTHLRGSRWRRSYHTVPKKYGTIERMALYLPFHCSCKRYSC